MTINVAKLSFGSMTTRSKTNLLVLHHAAAKTCSVEDVHRWHLNNGWSGIGYHFLVRKDGSIWQGRPIDKVGAHALNYNSKSIGICFEGNFEIETMPEAQKKAGKELVAYVKSKYPTITSVKGHRDLMATACPGKNFPFDEIAKAKSTAKKYTGKFPKVKVTYYVIDKKGKKAKKTRNYLMKGDISEQVKHLQKFLNWYGGYELVVDGDFGTKTLAAVKDFQEKEKLVVDGLFGKNSLARAKIIKK